MATQRFGLRIQFLPCTHIQIVRKTTGFRQITDLYKRLVRISYRNWLLIRINTRLLRSTNQTYLYRSSNLEIRNMRSTTSMILSD